MTLVTQGSSHFRLQPNDQKRKRNRIIESRLGGDITKLENEANGHTLGCV